MFLFLLDITVEWNCWVIGEIYFQPFKTLFVKLFVKVITSFWIPASNT